MRTLLLIGALAGVVLAGALLIISSDSPSSSSLLGMDGNPIKS